MVATPQATPQGDIDPIRRWAYLAALALIALLLVALLIVDGFQDPFERIAFPIAIAICAGLFVALWQRRLSLRACEVLLLVPPVVVLFGYLVVWHLSATAGEPIDFILTALWVWLTFPLCFLALGTRNGLRACALLYVAFLLVSLPILLDDGLSGSAAELLPSVLLSLAGLFAVSIALLWALASRLEQLAVARSLGCHVLRRAGRF